MRHPERRRCIDDISPEARRWAENPDWEVKLIHHDPDGPCEAGCPEHVHGRKPKGKNLHADFGYTVGLHDYGLPELHCASVPAVGPPGYNLDWQSVGMVLNRTAAQCITGELAPGDRFELTASRYGHRFHMTWKLGEPGPLEAVSAYQAHPDATAIPIVWVVDDVECLA